MTLEKMIEQQPIQGSEVSSFTNEKYKELSKEANVKIQKLQKPLSPERAAQIMSIRVG